jgi:hypothetical protein
VFENFLEQAEKIVTDHRTQYKGVYYMKGGVIGAVEKVGNNAVNVVKKASGLEGWNAMRDQLETAASLAGNYILPGSSLVTDQLVSQGSKKQLSSPLGAAAQLGTGLAGAGVGSSVTGIPQSVGGAAEQSAISSIGNAAGNAASSVGSSLGLTSDVAPWIDPDLAATGATAAGSAGGAAAPWVNPDLAITPGAAAATGAPQAFSAGEANLLNQAGNAASAPITATELSSLAAPQAATQSTLGSVLGAAKTALPVAAGLNTLAPLISGAGLAATAAKGNETTSAGRALESQAQQAASAGQNLQSYLPNGTLPPGAQAGIDQAKNSAKAAIRSKYASMGMSGSSSEQQELSAVDSNAQAQGEQLALQLLNSGIQESQLSSQLYQNILNGQLEQDKNLSSAIGNFASSVAGGAKSPITVNV